MTFASGETSPAGVSAGATAETTVSILDDDDPEVEVSFAQSGYTVAEGSSVTVTVHLSADPKRTVTIPIGTVEQGGASSADYGGVPDSVTFASGETSRSFTFSATDDAVDDDGESVQLSFGALPARVTAGATSATTVSITDDDDPEVEVSFAAAGYTVAEGSSVTVTVELSADPERTVTIGLTSTGQGGASSEDYSGVPDSVTFTSGETSRSFRFSAMDDTVDDDGESVQLSFDTLPARVSAGATSETTVSILDDDDPEVEVSFAQSGYTVSEGSSATITVHLSADPERTVTIGLTSTEQGGASSADYAGVPNSVTFASGETSRSFTFSAMDDAVDDDGESVQLSFETLPAGVSAGTTPGTTVSILDDDDPEVEVSFAAAGYTVTEGSGVAVTVELSADPERTVTIGLTSTEQGGASSADYAGVPGSVTFTSGETSVSFTFRATADGVDDDGESVQLSFSTLPARVSPGTTPTTTVSILDDEDPEVEVSFAQSEYTVAEGSGVTVTVHLSADPERTVTIPIGTVEQGGASIADYAGVPGSMPAERRRGRSRSARRPTPWTTMVRACSSRWARCPRGSRPVPRPRPRSRSPTTTTRKWR